MKTSRFFEPSILLLALIAILTSAASVSALPAASREFFEEDFQDNPFQSQDTSAPSLRLQVYSLATPKNAQAKRSISRSLYVGSQDGLSDDRESKGKLNPPQPNGTTTNATWNGASGSSNNWNDTANWVGNNQPSGGSNNSTITYGATSSPGNRTTSNNDYGDDSQFEQIVFTNLAPSYTLTGSRIKLFDVNGNGVTGKIENSSANLQTISFSGSLGFSLLFESSFELDPTGGDLTINNNVLLDANSPTISVYGNNGHLLTFNGMISQNTSGANSIQNLANNVIVFNAANTYSGNTFLKTGELRFGQSGSANSSAIFLGDTSGTLNAAVTLAGSTAQTLSSSMTVQSGNTGIETLSAQNTSGTSQWNGAITLNKSLTVAATNSGGTLQLATITAPSVQTLSVGDGTTTNSGTLSLAGSSDNVNLAVTVNSGTLLLSKASNSGVHAVGGTLTVNTGATARLSGTGDDQLFSGSSVTVNSGGAFDTNDRSEGFGVLSLAGTGIGGTGALLNSGTASSTLTPTSTSLTANATIGVTNSAGSLTLANVVSGSGFSLTKVGNGTLTLNGANTYTGGTILSAGTLKLGSSSVGTPGTVGSNGALTSGPLGTGSFNITGGFVGFDLNGQTFGNRWVNSNNNNTIKNTGAATAFVTGAMDGGLNGGVISDFSVGNDGGGGIVWTGQLSRTNFGSFNMTKVGNDTVTFSGTTANVGVGNTNVNAGILGLGMTGTSAGTFGDSVTVQGGTLKFRPDLGTVSGGNAWGGQINGSLQMTSGTTDLFGSSGQNSRVQQFSGTGGTLTNTSATAGVLGIAARNNTAYTFGGTIQDGTGTVGIDFTNSGTTGSGRINQFTGTNTYSGPTTISYGTFELGSALAAQNSTITVNSASGLGANGTIAYTTINPLAFANGIGTFTIGGLSGAGSFALTDIGFTNANVAATAASVTLQIGSSLAINAAPAAYSGVISDGSVAGGKVVKIGTSVLTLSGMNTYTGGTTIKNGTISIGTANTALGTGTLTLGDTSGSNNAALTANLVNTTLANAITVAAGSSGTRTISSVNGGGSTATFSGAVALNADLILAQNFTSANSGTLSLTGQITGAANILVTNTSGVTNSVSLSGNNAATFTGNVSITNGEILRTSATALGTANTVTIDATSQLNSNGQSLTVGGLNSTGAGGSVVISTTTAQTLTLGGTGSYNYAGVISNNGNVTKSGGGTQILSGSNTYSGATTVSGGTLLVNNTSGSGTGTGAVTVNNSGTVLGGTGTISGAVNVNAGAAITAGTRGSGNTIVAGNVGTFSTGALTLVSSAIFHADISGASTYDVVNVTGAVALGNSTLELNIASGISFSTPLILINNDSTDAIVGTFAGLNQGDAVTANGYTFYANYFGGTGNDFELDFTPVPEPSTWAAAILTVLALGWSQRRRLRVLAGK